MNILNWGHPDASQSEETSLSAQANAGDTTLSVINTKGFTTNQLLLVGSFESEFAEIVKTHASTSPNDSVITLAAALKHDHSTDTPIVVLDYDQIEISRASAKGGSYSVIDTIDITPDEEGTTYKDATGSTTDYYKIRYKNSIDSSTSGYSSEIPAGGLADDTLGGMISTVYKLFSKHSNKILDRAEVIKYLNEGADQFYSAIIDLRNVDLLVKYGTDGNGALIPFVAGQRAYDLPADFARVKRVYLQYGSKPVPATPIDSTFDAPDLTYSQSSPEYFLEDDTIVPKPAPSASGGGILLYYRYRPAKMANDDDVPKLPQGHRTKIVNYAMKRVCESDNKFDVANYYGTIFDNDKQSFISEVKTRYPELPDSVPMFGVGIEDERFDGFSVPGVY